MGLLEGKVAIITGGARGQGAEEARLFLEEGASVILTDLNPAGADLAAQLGEQAIFQLHDVASVADWKTVGDLARERFGKVDILVNNAGVAGWEPTQTVTADQIRRYFDIHVMGALFGMQAIVPLMPESGGSIVNIASTAAIGSIPSYVGYGTSKWALRGLSRYAARDLIAQNVRVNCVLPGGVETEMLNAGGGGDLIDAARAMVPMNRFGEAGEIAQVVLFLASDKSSYMTGSEIIADGGMNA